MNAARKPTVKVVPGQIWADKYPGSKGRTVRIIEVGPTHATVEVVTEAHSSWSNGNTIGRQTRVSYGPRGLNGYQLESEPENVAPAAAQEYDFDTATSRQVVEHWLESATAGVEKDDQDKGTWMAIEIFAKQVLIAMDREARS